MIGVVNMSGDFKEISATKNLERKSWESLKNIPSFYVFNHRGRALSPYYEEPSELWEIPDRFTHSIFCDHSITQVHLVKFSCLLRNFWS